MKISYSDNPEDILNQFKEHLGFSSEAQIYYRTQQSGRFKVLKSEDQTENEIFEKIAQLVTDPNNALLVIEPIPQKKIYHNVTVHEEHEKTSGIHALNNSVIDSFQKLGMTHFELEHEDGKTQKIDVNQIHVMDETALQNLLKALEEYRANLAAETPKQSKPSKKGSERISAQRVKTAAKSTALVKKQQNKPLLLVQIRMVLDQIKILKGRQQSIKKRRIEEAKEQSDSILKNEIRKAAQKFDREHQEVKDKLTKRQKIKES
jgi:hypothetical protein